MIAEFIRKQTLPRHQFFLLLREIPEAERKLNHGRLPSRLWLILFPNAGAAMPFAIVDEWDDGRSSTDLTDDGADVTEEVLQFWWDTGRRMGDW